MLRDFYNQSLPRLLDDFYECFRHSVVGNRRFAAQLRIRFSADNSTSNSWKIPSLALGFAYKRQIISCENRHRR